MFGSERTDDGPLVRGASPASGMFPGRGHYRPLGASTVRIAACVSLLTAVLWVWGFASLFAVALGGLAVSSDAAGRTFRVIGAAGLVLGIIGIGWAGYLAVTL